MGNSGRGTIELLSKLNETPNGFAQLRNFSYFSNAAECADQLTGVAMPNFRMFGMDMGLVPTAKLWPLILVPIFTFVFYFASMKLNRKFMYQPAAQDPQMGCSNNMMDITMPLMSVYIAFITPAAIGLYWIFKCIIGVVKQYIIHKAMPLPTFTEADYKKAEKEMKARSKGQRLPTVIVAENGQQYRSLHHIDDEDELPPRDAAVAPARESEASESTPVEEPKMGAPLKEDRKNDEKNKK
jgi:YidC/Oxa1 family membrane protein insertase